jgi:L-ascorbate metabolism protein UlaG (beta-lactamase superfamily)
VIALTHGHFDHIHDAVELARRHSCKVVAIPETGGWLSGKGVENVVGFNKGGTVEVEGIKFTMTHAEHTVASPTATRSSMAVRPSVTSSSSRTGTR